MKTPICEQEITITIMRGEPGARIYTSDYNAMRKFDALTEKSDQYELESVNTCEGEVTGKTYRVKDKRLLTFRAVRSVRALTDEDRARMAERMKTIQAARKGGTDRTE